MWLSFLAGDAKPYWHRQRFFWFLGCAINVWKLQLQKEMLSVLWPREHTVKMLCPVPLAPGQHCSALSCQKQEVRKANSYLTEKTRTKAGCFFSPLHTVVTATKHHISNLDLTYLFVAQGWFLSFHSCCWTSDIPHTYVTWTPILIKNLPNAIYTQNLWFRHESGNITQRTYALCYFILHALKPDHSPKIPLQGFHLLMTPISPSETCGRQITASCYVLFTSLQISLKQTVLCEGK